jgi:glycosyltransferase involved in cell wall biosynthesis
VVEIKEVTVFTNGDSGKSSTWSNVPFFFTETLKAKGIKVNRVDIKPTVLLRLTYDKLLAKVIRLKYRKTTYTYFRTGVNNSITTHKIKKALQKYNNSDLFVFLTFSFSAAEFTKTPVILFCDWTYDHHVSYFGNKTPDTLERASIQREDTHIEQSDMVFVLFPEVVDYMKDRYRNRNIFYIGNVVNSLVEPENTCASERRDLLFIGSKQYLEGATTLIRTFQLLDDSYSNVMLHIIGLDSGQFHDLPARVKCYGYLDKNNPRQAEIYYNLLNRCSLLVNTTPKWAAFSATIEAMYFYNAIITTPYAEITKTFGTDIDFGFYCEDNTVECLFPLLKRVLDDPARDVLCAAAHDAVKEYTWNSYVDKMLDCVTSNLGGDPQHGMPTPR